MKKDSLTKQKKKSIIQGIGFVFLLDIWKRFQSLIKTFPSRSLTFFINLPHKGRKVSIMKTMIARSFGGKNVSFTTKLTLVAGAVLILAACGGGGGSTPAPTPTPTAATGTITTNGCTVADGASACGISVVWTSSNASLPRVTLNGVSVSSLANGSGTFSISLGTTTVAVSDGNTVPALASATAFAVCGINSAVVNGVCQPVPAVLHYTDKVYAIWTGGRVQAVTKTGVTEITNKTSFPGTGPFFNCWLPKPSVGILSDGKIIDACQDVTSLRRHYLALNPVTNEHTEYTGPIPATLQCTENTDKTWSCPANTDWVSVQGVAPAGSPANDGTATQVSDGWYFTSGGSRLVLKYKATATGIESVVKAGTFSVEGPVQVLFTYSN